MVSRMERGSAFNPKRHILSVEAVLPLRDKLQAMARAVRYGGNPEHKRNPGDFGLTPPSSPRRGKTLCDDLKVYRRVEAQRLVASGLRRGMVDARWNGEGWPQLVWAMDESGAPLEAQREADGCYHGYPIPIADPMRQAVSDAWETRHE